MGTRLQELVPKTSLPRSRYLFCTFTLSSIFRLFAMIGTSSHVSLNSIVIIIQIVLLNLLGVMRIAGEAKVPISAKFVFRAFISLHWQIFFFALREG